MGIPIDQNSQIPDMDPTRLKAIAIHETLVWQGVYSATKNYNGPGDPNYAADIETMVNNAQDPKPEDYVEKPKPAATNAPKKKK